MLLADDAVARPLGLDQLAHRGFRFAIGARNGRAVVLALVSVGLAEPVADDRPRGIGEGVGEGDVGPGDGHSPRLSAVPFKGNGRAPAIRLASAVRLRRLPMRYLALAAALLAAPAAAALAPGAKAPDFTTRGAIAGKVFTVHLADQLKKGPVVLYFFPAAFTPGCNAEARAFAQAVADFRKAGATVIGMSADPVEDLQRFSSTECAGKFAVASAGPAVIAGYDVALGRERNGRPITSRTSYVIARDGRIASVHADIEPTQHVALTLKEVTKLPRR